MAEDSSELLQPILSDPSKQKPMEVPANDRPDFQGRQAVPMEEYDKAMEARKPSLKVTRRGFLGRLLAGGAVLLFGAKAVDANRDNIAEAVEKVITGSDMRDASYKDINPTGNKPLPSSLKQPK